MVDGSTSSDQNPSHTYNDSGRYTVSLTVSDGTNNSVTTKNNLIKIANKVGSDVILGLYESPMILQGQNISKINKN